MTLAQIETRVLEIANETKTLTSPLVDTLVMKFEEEFDVSFPYNFITQDGLTFGQIAQWIFNNQ